MKDEYGRLVTMLTDVSSEGVELAVLDKRGVCFPGSVSMTFEEWEELKARVDELRAWTPNRCRQQTVEYRSSVGQTP